MGWRRSMLGLLLLALALVPGSDGPVWGAPEPAGAWQRLEAGLELGGFAVPAETAPGSLRVLRVDPALFELRLLMSSELAGAPRYSVGGWCDRFDLLGAINASMFQEDRKTSTSLMRSRTHVNNGHLTPHRAVLVFDRLDNAVPPVQIVDRDAQDFAALSKRYGTHVQSIRMIALDGRNVWEEQPEKYSVAAIAIDRAGRVLLIHSATPFTVHHLGELLLALPLGIRNAMYVEGGPTAQLAVRAGGRSLDFTGAYEAGFIGEGQAADPVPVPFVVGVARRKAS